MANQQDGKPNDQPAPSSSRTKQQASILPITPDREKMSRALGAAFLQHKVQQLERNVDDLSFRRDLHQIPPRSHHPPANSNHSSRNQSKKKSSPQPDSTPSSSKPSSPAPIKVIDTSMLIHALPILKKWVREEKFKIVIPLDVVSELDFLKTSPPPIHGLVREATCWLDKQFQNSRKPSSTGDQPCFIPQRTGDESGWEELSRRFVAPPLEEASIPFIKAPSEDEEHERVRDGEDEEPQIDYRALISTDLPHQYRSLLQCALFYQLHAQPKQESELVIFFSDKQISSTPAAPQENTQHNHHQHHQNWKPSSSHWKSESSLPQGAGNDQEEEERVDKTVDLSQWAERFEIKIQKVHPADLTQAKQWIRSYNDKLKQQQQQQQYHPHSHRLGSSSSSNPHATSNHTTPTRTIHSNKRLPGNPRQIPASAPKPSAPSSSSSAAAVDKRLFVW
ncbi:hypothetical protein PGTUg99_024546 [Puccinia graminis f. sp. tritici]|uniref:PIN domain-containing protein n=1 Tax=Puccinia graminis f. sp. tritici TaxID=56615 RepID=A0A5B0R6G8_PUCGR|nr:hypothetical protein PGTUg99_024546 [Puccinia graminis f. sp. tritici]